MDGLQLARCGMFYERYEFVSLPHIEFCRGLLTGLFFFSHNDAARPVIVAFWLLVREG
jgi:hypothetical protein